MHSRSSGTARVSSPLLVGTEVEWRSAEWQDLWDSGNPNPIINGNVDAPPVLLMNNIFLGNDSSTGSDSNRAIYGGIQAWDGSMFPDNFYNPLFGRSPDKPFGYGVGRSILRGFVRNQGSAANSSANRVFVRRAPYWTLSTRFVPGDNEHRFSVRVNPVGDAPVEANNDPGFPFPSSPPPDVATAYRPSGINDAEFNALPPPLYTTDLRQWRLAPLPSSIYLAVLPGVGVVSEPDWPAYDFRGVVRPADPMTPTIGALEP